MFHLQEKCCKVRLYKSQFEDNKSSLKMNRRGRGRGGCQRGVGGEEEEVGSQVAANAHPQSNTDQPAPHKYSTIQRQIQINPCNIPVIGMLRPTWEPLGMSKLPNWKLRPTIDMHAPRPHHILPLRSRTMRAILNKKKKILKTFPRPNQSQTNRKTSRAKSKEVVNKDRKVVSSCPK